MTHSHSESELLEGKQSVSFCPAFWLSVTRSF